MITPKKLKTLTPEQCIKKIAYLARDWKNAVNSGNFPEFTYVREVLALLPPRSAPEKAIRLGEKILQALREKTGGEELQRLLNSLFWNLLEHLGTTPGDWDLQPPPSGVPGSTGGPGKPSPGEIVVFMEDIRSPFNLGSMFRVCEAFGVKEILLSPHSVSPEHPRAQRSSMGCTNLVPWRVTAVEDLPEEYPLIAMETGGIEVADFTFPRRGLLAVGSEELGISSEIRRKVKTRGSIVSIPMAGLKGSLNVGVALGIILHRWHSRGE